MIHSTNPGLLHKLLRAIPPLRDFVTDYLPRVWRLEGQERVSGQRLSVTFCGQVTNKNYIADLAFKCTCTQTPLPRWSSWKLASRGPWGLAQDELVVFETTPRVRKLLRGRCQIYIPTWVGGTLEIDLVLNRLRRSRNAKKDMSRIRNAQFSYEVRTDPQAFDDFYVHMYVPYITKAFGNRAFVMGYQDMVSKIDRSELFLIKKGDEHVAGEIIVYEGDVPKAWSVGVRDGNREYVRAGALKAIEYFRAIYLRDKGFQTCHLGGSRPFLNDGVLRKKRAAGMQITDESPLSFGLMFAPRSDAVAAFLASNPVILSSAGRYWSAVFVDQSTPLLLQQIQELYDRYYVSGTSGLKILLGERTPEPVAIPAGMDGQISVTPLASMTG